MSTKTLRSLNVEEPMVVRSTGFMTPFSNRMKIRSDDSQLNEAYTKNSINIEPTVEGVKSLSDQPKKINKRNS